MILFLGRYQRRWLSLVAAILTLSWVGCGRPAPSKPAANPSPATTAAVETKPAPAKPAETAQSNQVAIAAAADLKFALDELLVEFGKEHPEIKATVTYGSSGNFFAQLSNKAPFDLYLSADIDYPKKLIEQELAIRESEFRYAVGHIVVWVPKDSPLKVEQDGMQTLIDPSIKRIAIANPMHAPYGRAALAALKSQKIHEQIEDKLVLAENIAQTAQFIETGAADIGIISLSLAMAPTLKEKGRYWQIPATAHPPIEQAGVILSWVKDRAAADAIREYMTSKAGREVLLKYGFDEPMKLEN
jgi:molybdate transport system substrate-binding protein